ncbi:MAG: hypothetical protein LBU46_03820 [Candidatus Accumulibacter sp.]|jgi:hypothetical protein|nr:hypothetical protein [Accumulibacter sp.]
MEMTVKPRFSTVCVLSLGFFCCAEIRADGVYVTRGENGPVFSDKPQPGSRELPLQPLTVIPAPKEPVTASRPHEAAARPDEGEARAAAAAYRSLTVVRPEDEGSVGDMSFLEVRLAVDPPLRRSEGHAFIVRIDGRFVDQRFTATDFTIPPGFWEDGYPPWNRGIQLEAAVVDGHGRVVARAPPVNFRVHPVALRPPYPRPARPKGQPPPRGRPAATAKKPGRNAPREEKPKAPLRGKR